MGGTIERLGVNGPGQQQQHNEFLVVVVCCNYFGIPLARGIPTCQSHLPGISPLARGAFAPRTLASGNSIEKYNNNNSMNCWWLWLLEIIQQVLDSGKRIDH